MKKPKIIVPEGFGEQPVSAPRAEAKKPSGWVIMLMLDGQPWPSGEKLKPITADVLQGWARGSTMLARAEDNVATFHLGELAKKINEWFGVQ